jgi:hypothetical protein
MTPPICFHYQDTFAWAMEYYLRRCEAAVTRHLETIRVIKACGVSRERHSFDKNDWSTRGILLEGR